jgi:SAM-dependent methyltransferase
VEISPVTNEEQARYWDSDESAHWLVYEDHYERMLAPFTGHLLTSAAIGSDDRVIDIGCGTGSTTRAAARVATEGEALGLDLSAAMLRQAVRRAQDEGLSNVRFLHGDAQVHSFTPDAGDVALSRFGVMFFADPVAAFANIARGLRQGGRMVFVCWQNLVENEWIVVPGAAAAQHVTLAPPAEPTAPGPFSLGERDRIAAILRAAGLIVVAIEPIAQPLCMGDDIADAVAFLKSTGIWKSLLGDADPPTVARVSEAVEAALAPYVTPDGVLLGSRVWLVTASRPEPSRASGPSGESQPRES